MVGFLLCYNAYVKEKEVILAYLEVARDDWLIARETAERAAHGNASFNAAETKSMGTIDKLLDELNALGAVAVQAV